MSEHRRKQSNPDGPSAGHRGPQPPPPGGGRPQGPPQGGQGPGPGASRRTARPQGQTARNGMTGQQPRLTRAEMRKAAQGKGRGAGAAAAPAGPKPKRLIDYPRWGKSGVRHWMPSFKQLLSGALLFFAASVGVVGYAYANTTVPPVNPSTQQQNNIFYWADGSVMATTGTVNRQNVSLAQVPVKVQDDFMAAEDETFETNSGIDATSILRAVKNMVTGGQIQSGSTITQQWVKTSILSNSQQTVSRKFNEIMISIKIGQGHYTKNEVMEGYLNSNYYGRGANGIEAAAEAYYGVHASQLTVSQGAFIAATVNQPSYYQDVDSDAKVKAAAVQRWTYVLDRMAKNGWMTAAERATYTPDKFPTPVKWAQNSTLKGQIGYLVQTAQNYVEEHTTPKLTDGNFANGGYRVYTTFDKKEVQEMSDAVDKMNKDHIDPKKRPQYDTDVQTGSAAVDPATGAVKALYGGPGMDKGHYVNNANSSGVPVGSTFKPIVMATALEKGALLTPGSTRSAITPDSKFNGDNGITIRNQSGTLITDTDPKDKSPDGLLHQQNDNTDMPGFITLRTAMDNSVNTPFVQLGEYVGYSDVTSMATNLGLDKSIFAPDTPGFYIGTSTPSAIRMANVYATFADGGVYHDPYTVTKLSVNGVATADQPVLAKPKSAAVMSADTANTINSMLQEVVDKGTATSVKPLGRPTAGKTGTTDEFKSAWFIGYTPQLSTAVTMFRENPKSPTLESMKGTGDSGTGKFFGGALPATAWLTFMESALNGTPTVDFPAAPKLGKGANESGAPSPSASASASATPSASSQPPVQSQSASPTISLSPSLSPSSSPSATNTCGVLNWKCGGGGGPSAPASSSSASSSASASPSKNKFGG
ncbi:transglycosylase domain-containing protein [Streptacidiphilus carbonis]|uniref:transglycosylase domain-containing protein n=1 Tax=Streptacidiphilus carbonis TaxID=105422 RepID=UPI000A00B00C|nr:transglycosylase domain-containing protein [Streptacidiphilus carbonis]